MSRIKVYRVEHLRTGLGPFGFDNPVREELAEHCAQSSLTVGPVADEDFTDFVSGHHVCGIWPLTKVHDWFGPYRESLLAAGFALFEYEPLLQNVLRSHSRSQVAFHPYAATPRRLVEWPSYFPHFSSLSHEQSPSYAGH